MTFVLLLVLALTASWTRLVQCDDPEEQETDPHTTSGDFILTGTPSITESNPEDPENTGSGDEKPEGADPSPRNESDYDVETNPTVETKTNTEDLNTVIIIPLVLTLLLISVILCAVFIYCRLKTKVTGTKEDHYLDNEDHEKVPMPMFEDDIPSVMELEMEDLENWITKDGGIAVDTGQI